MNNLKIYRNGSPLFNLIEKGKRTIESASINRAMLSDDSVTIRLVSNSVLDIRINDYFLLFGSTYRINALPTVTKQNDSYFEYDIIAQGQMFDMLRCKYFNADGNDFKTDIDFLLIGTIETFLICLKNNMQRFDLNWEIGSFVNGETKTLTFGDDSCLSALQKICSEFETDFWIKVENGKFVIHTGDFGKTLPLKFEYGKGKGLYSLVRSSVDDNDIINRLYVFGGSNNVQNGYRNFSTKLKLPASDFIEDQSAIAYFGLKEGSIEFSEIYPKRTGKITALGDTKFKFVDNTMDFDLNEKETDGITTKYLISGTSAKVHFNTGNLAGYEFEIKKGGYDHASKTFEVISFKNDSGQVFPDVDSEAFQFAVGDEYVILDIVMPDSYITNAENELLVEGLKQFELHKNAKVSYDLEVDPAYMEKIGIGNFDIGDYVQVFDEGLGIDKILRINQTTVNFIEGGVFNPFKYKIVIADSYEINYASQVILDIKEIKNVLSITNLGNINYSKLGLKTTQELQNLVFDTDDYFNPENIRPNSIETNMLTVGAKSQQLSCSCVFFLMVDGNKNKVTVNPGIIYSQTFDKSWNVGGQTIVIPDDAYRYVYAKCSKTDNVASIHFTQDQIKFDEDANDYYFLLGTLHTVVDDVRVLSITFGTTTINGALIRTGIISSLDNQTYFNLNTGEIKGKIKFANGSDGFTSIDGGLLMSEVIEVGENGNTNAFVSGKTDAGDTLGTSVRFGAGADFSNRNTAPFRVQHNGKMIAENAEIVGKINATEGYIGGVNGWKITSTTLTSTSGKLLFGSFSTSGELVEGISISADNYPDSPTFRNRFKISSDRNDDVINNISAVISASGGNLNNTALSVSASGGNINNAIFIESGYLYVSEGAQLRLESLNSAIVTPYNGGLVNGKTEKLQIGTGSFLNFSNGLYVGHTIS